MNVQYVKVFCFRFSWFSVANAFRAVGSLRLEQLHVSSNKVGMIDGFLHKVTTIVSCQKIAVCMASFPNPHLKKSYKEVWCVFSLITSIGSWQPVLAVDNGKSSHWLGVRDLTQLKSCMLYTEIKAEFRNQGINQIRYGCLHLRSGTREIRWLCLFTFVVY